jgi:hypothetical protein
MRRVCKVGGTVTVVNHFGSDHRVAGLAERFLTPLTLWIGFSLDVPVSTVTGSPGLRTEREERVNLLRLWRLIEMRRED